MVNDEIFKGFAEGRSEGINGFTTVFLREGDEVTLHNNLEQSVMGLEDALFTYFGMLLFWKIPNSQKKLTKFTKNDIIDNNG